MSKGWRWRYLRGLQCILQATHGVVTPNPDFFDVAFGEFEDEFLKILSMPDRYIIHRKQSRDDTARWRKCFGELDEAQREEFLSILVALHRSRTRKKDLASQKRFRALLKHYYPGGRTPHD